MNTPSSQGRLLPSIRVVGLSQPLVWLVLGWHDLRRAPLLSLSHGLLLALGAWLIVLVAHDRFWLIAGSVSGFMVLAPMLATSLYAMSRAFERGETVDAALLLRTWTQWQLRLRLQPESYWSLIRFGLLLALAATGWVITSSALITLLSPVPIEKPMDFVRHIVLARDHRVFELWMVLGGLMAAPMFASSVVSMPLLLDRRVSVLQSVLTSWKAVLINPLPLGLWAFLILCLSLTGMALAFVGLVLVIPLLGHASWHAYRALVDPQDFELRMQGQGTETVTGDGSA